MCMTHGDIGRQDGCEPSLYKLAGQGCPPADMFDSLRLRVPRPCRHVIHRSYWSIESLLSEFDPDRNGRPLNDLCLNPHLAVPVC